MGLFDFFRDFGMTRPTPHPFEGVQVPPMDSVRTLRVYGTIYHQNVLSKVVDDVVPIRVRQTTKSDRFKQYAYQVFMGDYLVGGLDEYAFYHGYFSGMYTYAYVDRTNAEIDESFKGTGLSSPDRITLHIPRRD